MATRADHQIALDGTLHPDFTPVAEALRAQLRHNHGGAAVCVYHRGECVVDLWGGCRDASGRPWTRDTMAPSFSTTKGVAATLLHVLVDRGLLDYDDPVSKHWPEFGQAGKERITVRQVLSHQSGLYHIRQMIDSAERMLDWEHMVRAIERTEPIHEPGRRTGYHGLTFGFLVGELARRVSGQPFPELVQEAIAKPLDLDGLYVGAPPEALPRAAELLWPDSVFFGPRAPLPVDGPWIVGATRVVAEGYRRTLALLGIQLDLQSVLDALAPRGIGAFDFGADKTLRVAIPAANGLFTARSLARMYAVLSAGGRLDGVQLLSRSTLARATEPQSEAPRRVVVPFDMRWRLGYHGIATTRGRLRTAFGHFGFGGSGGFAEPNRDLAVALIVNSGLGTPFGDLRILRVGGAALESVERREPRPSSWAGRAGVWALQQVLDAV